MNGRRIISDKQNKFSRFCAIYDKIIDAWPFKVESCFIETRLGRTHALIAGDAHAPPLVLLHGGNSTAIMWADFLKQLASGYRLIAVDLICDYGKTVYQKPVKKVDDYLVWLEELLLSLGLKSAFFAGFSYGGWLVINLCLHKPELVQKASCYAPAGGLIPLSKRFLLQAAWTFIFPQKKIIKDFFLNASHPSLHSDPEYIKEVDELVELVEAGRKLRANFVSPRVLTDVQLSSIVTPVQLFIGDSEVICDPHQAVKRAKNCFKSAETFLLADASHDLMYTYKEFLCRKIIEFFD